MHNANLVDDDRRTPARRHILTIDLEDWFHLLEIDQTKTIDQWIGFPSRVEAATERILLALEEAGAGATFFSLGWIAERHPALLRKIVAAGHTLGTHSYGHQLIGDQSRTQFREDLIRSIGAIEAATGRKVQAYRAPGFSITRDTTWAYPILAGQGIEFDSSLFVGQASHGGIPGLEASGPSLMSACGVTLKEFPLLCGRVLGMNLPYSGGGYFRVLPYPVVRSLLRRSEDVITYFHPRDFDADQPRLPGMAWRRRFKSYAGIGTSYERFRRMLRDFRFVGIEAAASTIEWHKRGTLVLPGEPVPVQRTKVKQLEPDTSSS